MHVAPARTALIRQFAEWIAQEELPPAYETPTDFGPSDVEGRPRYILTERLGVGAHGEVYRATDRLLPGEVAIKIVADATTSRMLLNEAAAVRHLTHPRIVQLREVIVDKGTVALAYELIDGVPLDRWVEMHESVSEQEAVDLILEVCEAISVAHGAGVVHLDLKPSNILMDDEGAKVADFGISRVVGDWSTRYSARGSIAFMAPEQSRMDEVVCAPRMDVYALGGLLAWLVTDECPNSPDLLNHDLFEPRKIRPEVIVALEQSCDPVLRRIVLRAIAPMPADRHQTAAELADDLKRWRERRPIEWQRPPVWRRCLWFVRRRPWTAVAAGAALAAIMGLTAALTHTRAAAETQRVESELAASRQAAESNAQRIAAARRLVRLMAEFTQATNDVNPSSDFLATNTILESLTDDSVLGLSETSTSLWSDRITVAGQLIGRERRAGRGDELLARLWENAQGIWLYRAGRHAEAIAALESNVAWLDGAVGPEDAWGRTARAILLCARVRVAPEAGPDIAALEAMIPSLTQDWVVDEIRAVLSDVTGG